MTEGSNNSVDMNVEVNTESFLDVPEDTEDLSNTYIGVDNDDNDNDDNDDNDDNESTPVGSHMGAVTRFFNRKGFGFIKGLTNNTDYFVHNSSICVQNNEYRKLFPGEYVSFDLETQEDGREQCVNVRGVQGGALLVENTEYSFRYYDKRMVNDCCSDSE